MADLARRAGRIGRFLAAGCLTLVLGAAILIFAGAVAGAPSEHDILSYGGHSIAYQLVESTSLFPQQMVVGPIAPTTSLTNARCEAWLQAHSEACPAATTLEATYWPALQPATRTLYVGVQSWGCVLTPRHFNVELLPSNLVLHCHATAPLVNTERPAMGVAAPPHTTLLIVSTASWPSGDIRVSRENRVDRWFSADVQQWLLGVIRITTSQ